MAAGGWYERAGALAGGWICAGADGAVWLAGADCGALCCDAPVDELEGVAATAAATWWR